MINKMNKLAFIFGNVLGAILFTGMIIFFTGFAFVHWLTGGSYNMTLHINLSGVGLIVAVLILILSLFPFYSLSCILLKRLDLQNQKVRR